MERFSNWNKKTCFLDAWRTRHFFQWFSIHLIGEVWFVIGREFFKLKQKTCFLEAWRPPQVFNQSQLIWQGVIFFLGGDVFKLRIKKTCFLEAWHTMYAACFQWFSIHLVKGAFFQGGEVFKLKWKNLSYEILSYNNGILKWLWTINLTFAIIVHCGFDFCEEHAL